MFNKYKGLKTVLRIYPQTNFTGKLWSRPKGEATRSR